MSSSLGQGYVALTPINLDTVPSAREGSKAGLLTLYWANVLAANKAYAQPVNLLQSYQTGQFTTVQALLIDNSLVAYPVAVFSRSTGQRVVVGPYTQQMSPLLVSVAPEFLITLQVPQGVVAQDQVATSFWFLNTPQAPYATTAIPSGAPGTSGEQLVSGTATLNQVVPFSQFVTVATLMSGFPAGTKTLTYTSITVAVTLLTAITGGQAPINMTVRISESGASIWNVTQTAIPGTAGLAMTARQTFASQINITGIPILLQISVATNDGGPTLLNCSVGYSFKYTLV